MEIRVDDVTGTEVIGLLSEHLQDMAQHSPPESVHALDLLALRAPDVVFWSVWERGILLGCGALRELDAQHGEIKSMRTASEHRGKGVARCLLVHIMDCAKQRGYSRLSLETGSMAVFAPARGLYSTYGFVACPPFAEYRKDPYSLFMTKKL